MAVVVDILEYIETLAPVSMKEDWDNVGLNCGHRDREVTRILVALDPFSHVCREAKDMGAELLVTHHALLWKPGFITDRDEAGRNTLFLIENGIAHINAHTNLDCAPGGVNDVLAETLGLSNIRCVSPSGVDGQGREWGLLRMGNAPAQPLEDFLACVKEKLGCDGLRYADGGKPVRKVAVGGGSCGAGMFEAAAAGCDTFVTADIKYNQFFDAKNLGLNLIDAGHFHTENPVVAVLASKLRAAFPEITVKISQSHHDCMKFY
ncbi:MAG: Nif3-like dinuclear metal center hexameric protein [Oscillospiraceae bacterium]|nr:Nif3-like dinuclear metal center hexameric protein [Oscillospiraceae bacterium]